MVFHHHSNKHQYRFLECQLFHGPQSHLENHLMAHLPFPFLFQELDFLQFHFVVVVQNLKLSAESSSSTESAEEIISVRALIEIVV